MGNCKSVPIEDAKPKGKSFWHRFWLKRQKKDTPVEDTPVSHQEEKWTLEDVDPANNEPDDWERENGHCSVAVSAPEDQVHHDADIPTSDSADSNEPEHHTSPSHTNNNTCTDIVSHVSAIDNDKTEVYTDKAAVPGPSDPLGSRTTGTVAARNTHCKTDHWRQELAKMQTYDNDGKFTLSTRKMRSQEFLAQRKLRNFLFEPRTPTPQRASPSPRMYPMTPRNRSRAMSANRPTPRGNRDGVSRNNNKDYKGQDSQVVGADGTGDEKETVGERNGENEDELDKECTEDTPAEYTPVSQQEEEWTLEDVDPTNNEPDDWERENGHCSVAVSAPEDQVHPDAEIPTSGTADSDEPPEQHTSPSHASNTCTDIVPRVSVIDSDKAEVHIDNAEVGVVPGTSDPLGSRNTGTVTARNTLCKTDSWRQELAKLQTYDSDGKFILSTRKMREQEFLAQRKLRNFMFEPRTPSRQLASPSPRMYPMTPRDKSRAMSTNRPTPGANRDDVSRNANKDCNGPGSEVVEADGADNEKEADGESNSENKDELDKECTEVAARNRNRIDTEMETHSGDSANKKASNDDDGVKDAHGYEDDFKKEDDDTNNGKDQCKDGGIGDNLNDAIDKEFNDTGDENDTSLYEDDFEDDSSIIDKDDQISDPIDAIIITDTTAHNIRVVVTEGSQDMYDGYEDDFEDLGDENDVTNTSITESVTFHTGNIDGGYSEYENDFEEDEEDVEHLVETNKCKEIKDVISNEISPTFDQGDNVLQRGDSIMNEKKEVVGHIGECRNTDKGLRFSENGVVVGEVGEVSVNEARSSTDMQQECPEKCKLTDDNANLKSCRGDVGLITVYNSNANENSYIPSPDYGTEQDRLEMHFSLDDQNETEEKYRENESFETDGIEFSEVERNNLKPTGNENDVYKCTVEGLHKEVRDRIQSPYQFANCTNESSMWNRVTTSQSENRNHHRKECGSGSLENEDRGRPPDKIGAAWSRHMGSQMVETKSRPLQRSVEQHRPRPMKQEVRQKRKPI